MEEWDRIVKSVSRYMNLGYWLGFHACSWNPNSGFTYNPSKIRKWLQAILAVLRIFYLLFLAIRGYQVQKYTTLPFHKRGQILYYFFVNCATSLVATYGTMFNYESLHNIIQSNLDMAMNFERQHGVPKRNVTGRRLQVIATGGLILTYFGAFMTGLGNMRSPHLPLFISSVAENPRSMHWRVGSTLIHTYISLNLLYNAFGITVIILLWVFCFLRPILGLRDLCEVNFSEMQQCRYYRVLGMSQKKLVSRLGTAIFAAHCAAIISLVWNLSEAVILHTPRGIVFGLQVLIINSGYQAMCSRVVEESEKLLEQWKTVPASRGFRKFHTACTSIRVPLGNFFYHDRALMLTSAALVLENFVNLVMMINTRSNGRA